MIGATTVTIKELIPTMTPVINTEAPFLLAYINLFIL